MHFALAGNQFRTMTILNPKQVWYWASNPNSQNLATETAATTPAMGGGNPPFLFCSVFFFTDCIIEEGSEIEKLKCDNKNHTKKNFSR